MHKFDPVTFSAAYHEICHYSVYLSLASLAILPDYEIQQNQILKQIDEKLHYFYKASISHDILVLFEKGKNIFQLWNWNTPRQEPNIDISQTISGHNTIYWIISEDDFPATRSDANAVSLF